MISHPAIALVLMLVLVFGCAETNSVPMVAPSDTLEPDGAPSVGNGIVWRPFVETEAGSIESGDVYATAFLVKTDSHAPALVLPLSLLTTSSGLSRDIKPSEVDDLVTIAYASDAFGASDAVRKLGPVKQYPAPDGSVDDAHWSRVGIVAFDLGTLRDRSLEFVPSTIQKDQRVWMVTAVYGGASPSQMCHPAKVQSVGDDGTFQYQFENQTLSMQATAGAPILGDDGKLVGIHLRGQQEGDEVVGEGFGGEALSEALNELLAIENVNVPADGP